MVIGVKQLQRKKWIRQPKNELCTRVTHNPQMNCAQGLHNPRMNGAQGPDIPNHAHDLDCSCGRIYILELDNTLSIIFVLELDSYN